MFERAALEERSQLDAAIQIYYTRYYRDRLGLPDWEQRVNLRLHEDDVCLKQEVEWVERWINYRFCNKRILLVGAGTGAEFVGFSKRNCAVFAVEPNPEAVKIGQLKARLLNIETGQFIRGAGEALPFFKDSFDFVWCYTVLEHVQCVRSCISEMIRVTRPLGYVFIETPDYRQFYEPHYKVTMPMFAPRWLLRLWLRVLRRPTEFLDSLQFVSSRFLANLFQEFPVTAFQVIHSWPDSWRSNPTFQTRLTQWVTKTFGIQRDQFWLLQKLERPR